MSVLAVEFGSILTQFSQRIEDSTTRAIDFYEKYVTEKLCLAEMHIDQVAKFKGLPAQRIRVPEEKILSPLKKIGRCSSSLKKMKRSSKVKVIEDFTEKSLINSLQKDLLQLDLDLNGSVDHRVNIVGYEDSFHKEIYGSGNKENEDYNKGYELKSQKSRERCEGVHVEKGTISEDNQDGYCGNQAVRKSLMAQFSEIKVKDRRSKESDRVKFQEKVDAIDFERICNSLNPSQASQAVDIKVINNQKEEEVIIPQLEIPVKEQQQEEKDQEESEQLYESNTSEYEEKKSYLEEYQEKKKKSSQCRLDDYVHKELTQEERMNRDIEQWNKQLNQASEESEGQIHFVDQGKNNKNNSQQNKKSSINLTGNLYSDNITENSEQVNDQEKQFENDSSDLCLLIEGQSDSNQLVTLPAENTRKGQFVLKQSEQFQELDGQLDQENTYEYEMTDYSSNESSNAGSPVFAWIDRIPANFSAPQLEKHHQNIFDAGIFASQNHHHHHAQHINLNSSNSNSQLTYPQQSQNYGSTQMVESLFGQQASQVGSNTNYLWQNNNPKFGQKQQQPMMSQQSQKSAASQNDNMKYCQSEMFSQNTFGFGLESGLFEEDSFKDGLNFSNYSQFLKNDNNNNNKQMQCQSQPQLQHQQSQNLSQQQQQYFSNESSQQLQFTQQNSNQILLQSPQKLKTEKQRKQLYCNNKAVPLWAEDLKKVSEQVRVQNAQKVLDPIAIFGHFAVENLNLRVVFKNTGKRYDEGRGSSANWRQDYTPEQIESLINATSHTPNKKKQSKFTSFIQNQFNSIKKKLL